MRCKETDARASGRLRQLANSRASGGEFLEELDYAVAGDFESQKAEGSCVIYSRCVQKDPVSYIVVM
jgi:hypothetical protein